MIVVKGVTLKIGVLLLKERKVIVIWFGVPELRSIVTRGGGAVAVESVADMLNTGEERRGRGRRRASQTAVGVLPKSVARCHVRYLADVWLYGSEIHELDRLHHLHSLIPQLKC